MPILNKIEIFNFQSHHHTVLELADFTAFVGPSSAGKTVVERALSWVFYNDWDASYPQDASYATMVRLTLGDGHRIVRVRLNDKNTARIIPPGMEEEEVQEFKDFGDEIPGVFDLLNCRPLTVGKVKLDLNFARQDPDAKGEARLFLIGETKPAKAQLLGRLYGAHVVNTMLRLMGKDKLEAGRRLKEAEKDALASRARLQDYADLPAHEAALQRAEDHIGELTAMVGLQGRIQALRAEFEAVSGRRWLTRFDFGVLRDRIGVLRGLADIRRQRAALLATAAAMADRRWLLAVDFPGIKNKLINAQELHALRGRINRLTLDEQGLRGRAWLLVADLPGVKAKLAALAALKAIAQRQAAAAAAAGALRDRPVYSVDTAALRGRLALLAELGSLRGQLRANLVAGAALAGPRADLRMKLANRQEAFREEIFAGGQCPLCNAESPAMDVAEISARINRLTGAIR